jgi:hypothetical protein
MDNTRISCERSELGACGCSALSAANGLNKGLSEQK